MKEKLKNKFLGINEVSDDKFKSVIILFIWIVLVSSLVVYIRVYLNNNPIEETIQFNSIGDIFNKYKDYDYDISIKDVDGNKALYKGTCKNTIDNGTRTIEEEIITYKVENNIILNMDTSEEINNLYDGYLSYFFTPSNIYGYINYLKADEKEDKNIKIYKYDYVYDDKDILFEITTTVDSLDNIIMTYDNKIYEMKFSK